MSYETDDRQHRSKYDRCVEERGDDVDGGCDDEMTRCLAKKADADCGPMYRSEVDGRHGMTLVGVDTTPR